MKLAEKYGRLRCYVEVPDGLDKHRCQYAREALAERPEFTDALVEALSINYFKPTRGTENGQIYELRGNLNFERNNE